MSDPTQLGKYEIQTVLGRGAMGVVYKAYDPHIERTVAIKTVRKGVLDPVLAAQYTARFKNEARAVGRLHHPNIVAIYEYGEDETVAYIAMEFVEGTGLREYLERKARFEFGHVVNIMRQLLGALDFAHSRGVVHRDIKPSNLIMTTRGELKIADFGIARIDTSELTMDGTVLGTPAYMSPEQCLGKPSDHRSDLFSAAVVFYELLVGRRPFTGTMEALMLQICHVEPRPPSELSDLAFPPAIDDVFRKALAKSPEARFQSAREFHEALVRAVGAAVPVGADAEATLMNFADVELPPSDGVAWDDTLLTTVEKQLARFVGPMAKVLVRQAATHATDVGELYSILASSIGDPEQRERFAAESHVLEASVAKVHGGHTGGHGSTGGHTVRSTPSRTTGPGTRTHQRPLEQAFIDSTVARLTVYLGPIAKIVAKRAAQQAQGQDDFVRIVAGHIGTQDRHAFLREVGYDDE